jgi:hypothetical protein
MFFFEYSLSIVYGGGRGGGGGRGTINNKNSSARSLGSSSRDERMIRLKLALFRKLIYFCVRDIT